MSFIIDIGVFVFLLGLIWFLYYFYKGTYELPMAYNRYLDAYRLKILEKELQKKGTSFEELEKFSLKFKSVKRKNELERIELAVKGEVKEVKPIKEK